MSGNPSIFDNWSVLDPGLERAQIDAALADVAGPGGVPITVNNVVIEGTPYFDVALPLGYNFYSITGAFIVSTPDLLAFAFSADDGATFTNDASSPEDGYATIYGANSLSPRTTTSTKSLGLVSVIPNVFTQLFASTLFAGTTKLVANFQTGVLTDDLHPGDPQTAEIEAALAARDVSGVYGALPGYAISALSLGGHPVLGRQNLIRMLPGFGNGDCNPPTSGATFQAGVWSLYGSN